LRYIEKELSYLMKSYTEFIAEGKGGLTNAGTIMRSDNAHLIRTSINFADETLEGLRRKFLDKFYSDTAEDETEKRNVINKCVSTFVYCLDKKLRIDADIMALLAKTVGMEIKELTKYMTEETEKFYGRDNLYGM
jgi:hypothetical protein